MDSNPKLIWSIGVDAALTPKLSVNGPLVCTNSSTTLTLGYIHCVRACSDRASAPTQIVFSLTIWTVCQTKIADFLTINRIPIELCFHAILTLIWLYLLLCEYQYIYWYYCHRNQILRSCCYLEEKFNLSIDIQTKHQYWRLKIEDSHAVILSLSHSFKISLRNIGFSGFFQKMENRKQKMSHLSLKNVVSAVSEIQLASGTFFYIVWFNLIDWYKIFPIYYEYIYSNIHNL